MFAWVKKRLLARGGGYLEARAGRALLQCRGSFVVTGQKGSSTVAGEIQVQVTVIVVVEANVVFISVVAEALHVANYDARDQRGDSAKRLAGRWNCAFLERRERISRLVYSAPVDFGNGANGAGIFVMATGASETRPLLASRAHRELES
ncbi:hypothetical protein ASPCAL09567 [Aspergillus calidoustus]|uniref:Uncharacterized protein n=1 Tax=Aspergillus calidoustus TaxID=454130 RepID=A0A0U5GW54_ASPCI|nr:hypothetical protein ASPCAL09567 [Aspergillus calidoustus]